MNARVAIEPIALDDIEGFAGEAARMERGLDRELAKRIVPEDPQSQCSRLAEMSTLTLLHLPGARMDRPKPEASGERRDGARHARGRRQPESGGGGNRRRTP